MGVRKGQRFIMNNIAMEKIFKKKIFWITIILLMIAEPTLNSLLNFWLQKLFDSAYEGGSRILILRLLTIGFIFWMIKRIIIYSSNIIRLRLMCDIKKDLKKSIFSNIIKNDIFKVLNNIGSGKYISVFTNDINILEQKYFENWFSLIANCFSIIILGGSFLTLNPKIGGSIFIFGFIALIIVPIAFNKKLNVLNLKYSGVLSEFTQRTKEFFEAYPTIKNYSIEEEIDEQFIDLNDKVEETKFDADAAISLANNVGSLLSWFMQFIATGLGLILVIKGEILIGTVIASQGFASDLAGPLQSIVGNINSINSVKSIIEKLSEFSNTLMVSEKTNTSYGNTQLNTPEKNHVGSNLMFRNVNLKIKEKIIISNFSYFFQSGKKYLIVGKNGSGKSSIFKSVKKYFPVLEGDILINDINISTLNNKEISAIISYMNEKVSLFSGKILDNICLFSKCNKDDILDAIKKVKLDINLQRQICDDGNSISSGEQRKIELARSFLKLVDILVLDEVLSNVDVETAYEIEKMILEDDKNTVIIISHNFSGKLIRKYDAILIVDNGALVASGNYDELLLQNDYFKKICEIKFGRIDIKNEGNN